MERGCILCEAQAVDMHLFLFAASEKSSRAFSKFEIVRMEPRNWEACEKCGAEAVRPHDFGRSVVSLCLSVFMRSRRAAILRERERTHGEGGLGFGRKVGFSWDWGSGWSAIVARRNPLITNLFASFWGPKQKTQKDGFGTQWGRS